MPQLGGGAARRQGPRDGYGRPSRKAETAEFALHLCVIFAITGAWKIPGQWLCGALVVMLLPLTVAWAYARTFLPSDVHVSSVLVVATYLGAPVASVLARTLAPADEIAEDVEHFGDASSALFYYLRVAPFLAAALIYIQPYALRVRAAVVASHIGLFALSSTIVRVRTGGEADAFAVVWMPLAWYNILGWLGAVAVHRSGVCSSCGPGSICACACPSLQRLVDRALDKLDKFDAERYSEKLGEVERGEGASPTRDSLLQQCEKLQEEAAVAASLLNQWPRQRCRSDSGDLEVAELLGAEGLAAEIDGLDGMAPWRPAFTSPGATAMHGGALTQAVLSGDVPAFGYVAAASSSDSAAVTGGATFDLDGGLLPGATGPSYVTTAGSCATVVAPSSAVARRIALLNEPALPPPGARPMSPTSPSPCARFA